MSKDSASDRGQGGGLTFVVPSKGRLQDATFGFLEACDLGISRDQGSREYASRIRNVPNVDVILAQADEVPDRLDQGSVHLGITGEDLLRENGTQAAANYMVLKRLGYGEARLVVAVPRSWIDVRSMRDLEDVNLSYRRLHNRRLRVATKYPRLTGAFLIRHGIADYRFVPSLGATEGMPTSNLADIIVDITSTGATLAANGLKTVDDGVVMRSEACLAASVTAPWSERALATLHHILAMIEARESAKGRQIVRFRCPSEAIAKLGGTLAANLSCTLAPDLEETEEAAPGLRLLELVCPNEQLYAVVECLRAAGCTAISASSVDYLFGETIEAYERFRLTREHRGLSA